MDRLFRAKAKSRGWVKVNDSVVPLSEKKQTVVEDKAELVYDDYVLWSDVLLAVEELKREISRNYEGSEESYLLYLIDEVFGAQESKIPGNSRTARAVKK